MEKNNQAYLSILCQAMFATVYYELFRVGELTIGESDHVILTRNVQIGLNKKQLLFLLHSSKTHGEAARNRKYFSSEKCCHKSHVLPI